MLLDRGELVAAERRFQESLALARQIGNRSAAAAARFGLGEVAGPRGDLAGAARHHQAALADRERLGERATAAESRLALADLRLEPGDAAAAEGLARAAQAELARQGASDGEALAVSLLGTALLARGDTAGARTELARAVQRVAGSEDVQVQLAVRLRGARLDGALGRRREAAATLDAVTTEALRLGLPEPRYRALLARAENEQAQGRAGEAQAQRALVAAEAGTKGYGLLARKAGAPGG